MKKRPLYENLDTSFVNLSALVKYLRRRKFTGSVRIEFGEYAAEIQLSAGQQLKAREHDRAAGRLAEGVEALQRIFIRAREPGGAIGVYETIGETETTGGEKTSIDERTPPAPRSPAISGLSFEFSNQVEAGAKRTALSPEDDAMLIGLTGELLGAVERCLAPANLDFSSAFRKACAEITADYPFLATLRYENGKIHGAAGDPPPKFLVAGVCEALRLVLERLAQSPRLAETHRGATQRILGLIYQRRALYERFSLIEPLERILGV
ncbi:MAG TPA: hypothetical protein VIL74_04835 [Pyrinomonadaceae bacterium]|jgi:hypothetical protein